MAYPFVRRYVVMIDWLKVVFRQSLYALTFPHLIQKLPDHEMHVVCITSSYLQWQRKAAVKDFARNSAGQHRIKKLQSWAVGANISRVAYLTKALIQLPRGWGGVWFCFLKQFSKFCDKGVGGLRFWSHCWISCEVLAPLLWNLQVGLAAQF